MTKAEYMQKLQEKLERFGQELQEEILEDYRQHFAEGEHEGKSEEEIIDELGNIEEMIKELSEEDLSEEFEKKALEAVGQELQDNEAKSDAEAQNEEVNRRFSYSGFYKAIVLEGKVADICVEPSDNDQIHVEYSAKGVVNQLNYEFYQYEEDGTFYAGVKRRKGVKDTGGDEERMVKVTLFGRTIISYGTLSGFDCSGQYRITLNVKVPRGVPKLTTKVSSGNIHVTGLELEALETSGGSGNIALESTVADRMKAFTGSGNIAAQGAEFIIGSFETGSGNVRAESVKGKELRCGTGSGNIKVDSSAAEYRLSTGSGNIKVRSVGATGRISASTGSGSVKVELEEVAGMEAKVKSGSGSIRIGWDGEESQKVKSGLYTYGDGSCKVEASTGSGSIKINRV